MVSVDPKKTVRIKIDPIPESNATNELADYMRGELRKRAKIQDVDLS